MSQSIPPMSPNSQGPANADLGFPELSMVRCYVSETNSYRLEIQETIKVDFSPTGPVCSACPAPDRNGEHCKHIFFVDRQVLHAESILVDDSRVQACPISSSGAEYMQVGKRLSFYNLFIRRGLELLADNKDWWMQAPGNEDKKKIEQRLTEIFSLFEPLSFSVDHDDNNRQRDAQQIFLRVKQALLKIVMEQPRWLFDLYSAVPLHQRCVGLVERVRNRIDEAFIMNLVCPEHDPEILDTPGIIRFEVKLLSDFVLANSAKLDIRCQQKFASILLGVLEEIMRRDTPDHNLYLQLGYEHGLILKTLKHMRAGVLTEPGLNTRMRNLAAILEDDEEFEDYLDALVDVASSAWKKADEEVV